MSTSPSKRLESLTVEQESLKSVIVKKWIDLSLNNGRKLQVQEVREGIDWIYEKAKLKSPLIIITPSPYFAQLTANYIKNIKPNILSELIKDFKIGDNVRDNVGVNIGDNIRYNFRYNFRDNVRDNVRVNIGVNIRDNVGVNIRDNIGDNVGFNIRDNIRDNVGVNIRVNVGVNVGDNISDNVRDDIRDNVGVNIGDNIRDNVRDNVAVNVGVNIRDNVGHYIRDNIKLEFFSVYNGLDYSSGWIAFYDYFEAIGLVQHKEFEKYRDVFAKGIWNCILFENVCIISETPTSVLRDNRGRLHSTARHCVEFKDGYTCAYFIHGVKFERGLWQKVVERKLTPKQLLEMKETDQRFVALNHYGFEKALKELNAKLIDKSKKGNKLYKIKFGEFDMKFLMYADTVNGNSRVSFVKPEFDDADQAMAWKHNMTKKQYLSLEIEA